MGMYAGMENFDVLFRNLPREVKFVNDYNVLYPEHREALDRHVYTHYKNAEVIETSAACQCGKYTRAQYIGYTCDRCDTEIVSTVDKEIEATLWIRTPEDVLGFINPIFVTILNTWMKTASFNFFKYLISTQYSYDYASISSKDVQLRVDKFLAANPPRGLNNFISHFDEIMDLMFDKNIIQGTLAEREKLRTFIRDNREALFPRVIPIPSRLCFVVETNASSTYIDAPLGHAMNAINSIASIRAAPDKLKPAQVQNIVAHSCESLSMFYDVYVAKRIAQKQGLARRHLGGGRLHLSARGVIQSINDPHYFRELHIPWGMGVQLLKYHILNKLVRRDYTVMEAIDLVYRSVLQYNKVIDDILKELIHEAGPIDPEFTDKHGIAVTLGRPPTLQRGSIQQFFVTLVKTAPYNNTISMSPVCLRSPNADSSVSPLRQ